MDLAWFQIQFSKQENKNMQVLTGGGPWGSSGRTSGGSLQGIPKGIPPERTPESGSSGKNLLLFVWELAMEQCLIDQACGTVFFVTCIIQNGWQEDELRPWFVESRSPPIRPLQPPPPSPPRKQYQTPSRSFCFLLQSNPVLRITPSSLRGLFVALQNPTKKSS